MNDHQPEHLSGLSSILRGLRGVIFDLDGTLIDSISMWKRIDDDFYVKHNITVTEEFEAELERMSFKDRAITLKTRYGLKESIEEMMDGWVEAAHNHYKTDLFFKPGVIDFLDWLDANGVKYALATANYTEPAMDCLRLNKALDKFKVIVSSQMVAKSKPAPDVFLLAAQKLGLKPEECLVFEDSNVGITAARAAGMRVVHVRDVLDRPDWDRLAAKAVAAIDSFADLVAALDKEL